MVKNNTRKVYLRDITTHEEKLELNKLRELLLAAETFRDAKFYTKKIDAIIDTAKKRYFSEKFKK